MNTTHIAENATIGNPVNAGAALFPRAAERRMEKAARDAAEQQEKATKKTLRRVNRHHNALERAGRALAQPEIIHALLTVPPRTKFPAIFNEDGSHGSHFEWTSVPLTLKQYHNANKANSGVGYLGRFIGLLDYDGESPELAALVDKSADTYCGLTVRRGRPNTQRFGRPYLYKPGTQPIKKWSHTFRKDGTDHKLEFIGAGGFWVADGIHPSGSEYTYGGGIDLCAFGIENLPEIDEHDTARLQKKIIEGAQALGFEYVQSKAATNNGGKRTSIDDPAHWAPTPELAIEALKARPNTAENNPSRDDLVRYMCAAKAALGPNREEYWGDVCDWGMEYEGNEEDDLLKIWESARDTSVGWGFLEAQARAHCRFDGGAQHDFADTDELPKEFTVGAVSERASGHAGRKSITATPFTLLDPATIPPRQFLYGRHYIRGFLSATTAPGGGGKSAHAIAEALSMVAQKNILGELPRSKLRVWFHNGEDPMDELQRRFSAAAMHHNITADDIADRLFVSSGRDNEITIAYEDRGGTKIATPVVEELCAQIRAKQIDVLIIDPFVASHAVSENDNNKINAVCRQFAMIGERTNCAIELVHHVRKGAFGQGEFTVDDARGASALLAAVRSARVLNFMSKDEAAKVGIDNPRSYFRVNNGKANLAPPSDKSTWRHMVSVQLGNGDVIPHAGDSVGVVTPWEWPDPAEDVTTADVKAVQDKVAAGEWRENSQVKKAWVGNAVADALGLDLGEAAMRAKVKSLIRTWLQGGVLKVVNKKDAKRMSRTFVEVGKRVAE